MASLSEVEAILVTALVAALLAAWGIVTQRIVARRVGTLAHFSSQEGDEDIIKARKTFNELSKDGGKLATYVNPGDLTDDETNAIRIVLNDYEILAIGVHQGIFDLQIISHYMRGTILRDWSKSGSFVHKLRNEVSNDKIYYEFECLAQWLQDKKKPARKTWPKLWF